MIIRNFIWLLISASGFCQLGPSPPFPAPLRPPDFPPVANKAPAPLAVRKLRVEVAASDGRPVGQSVVTVTGTDAIGRDPRGIPVVVRKSGKTSADGTVELLEVPVGRYVLCLSELPEPYYDPCQWGESLGVALLKEGADAIVQATAHVGGLVLITVVDPTGAFLNVNLSDPMSQPFRVGVRNAAGRYYSGFVRGRTSLSIQYSIVVPFDQDLEVVFFSRDYDVVLSGGERLDGVVGKGSRFRIPRETGTRSVGISLTLQRAVRIASPSLIW